MRGGPYQPQRPEDRREAGGGGPEAGGGGLGVWRGEGRGERAALPNHDLGWMGGALSPLPSIPYETDHLHDNFA